MLHVTVRNGLTLAYVVGLVNAALVLVTTFGLTITPDEQAAIVGFVNAVVLLAARVLHLPEKTADGGSIAVRHVPVLVETPPHAPAPIAVAPPVPTEPPVPPTSTV